MLPSLPFIHFRLVGLLSLLALTHAGPSTNGVINRDVCIIGGGSTGTYAAVQLKDQGKSLVIIEKNNRLGGHAETEYLPEGGHIDYGVEGVFNNDLSKTYLQRLHVEYKSLRMSASKTDYVDFKTGSKVSPKDSLLNSLVNLVKTLLKAVPFVKYRIAIGKFDFLKDGVHNLPDQVPEELLQPFSDFVKKHGLDEILNLIFMFSSSDGNMLDTPLLYVLQNFGIPHINALIGGYIVPNNGMAEVYKQAASVLGPDNIIFESTASKITRSSEGASVIVQGANGQRNITCGKLLFTIPPTPDNMQPFDLDSYERSLFQKWQWSNYYGAILNNTGLPDDRNIVNLDPTKPHSLPTPPFQWALEYMGVPGYRATKTIADQGFSADNAKDLILSDIKRMSKIYPIQEPEIIAIADHTPTAMKVSNEDIRNGFYKKFYALQGQKNTYYTGLSICSDYSSLLWAYTKKVVDEMYPKPK